MNVENVSFDDETIFKLFGAQAAEDESAERLRGYFVKNKSYDRLRSDIGLRIVVGHKGIGKSALLRISHLEDKEDQRLSIWLRPSDIAKTWSSNDSFVEKVEEIKINILNIIARKSLDELNIFGKKSEDIGIITNARHLIYSLTKHIRSQDGEDLETIVAGNFLASKKVSIYVDDVDRGWAASSKDISNVSALINAARDLVNDDDDNNLKFCIGLRTDAFNLARSANESGDKFEDYQVRLSWSNHDILVVMAKRVSDFFGGNLTADELMTKTQKEISALLEPIISSRFEGSGHWSNAPIHRVLLSLTRERPRDLIKLLSGAAKIAYNNSRPKISTTDLIDSFPAYSRGRIEDLISEFGSELPQIDRVIYSMKPTSGEKKKKLKKFIYRNDELIKKLNGIAVNQNISFSKVARGEKATGQTLAEFLYKIDFIVARRDEDNFIRRFYYRDHSELQSNYVDFGFAWEVHPAYRWALEPTNVISLLSEVD